MADICIAYSRTDVKAAKLLFEVLSQSWDVWWDYALVGNHDDEIEREVPQAKYLIPVLTHASRKSQNVKDEWRLARKHNVEIIPAKLEECDAPYGFYAKSYVELFDWNGEADHPGIKQLQAKISSLVAPRTAPKRPKEIENGRIKLPTLFHSVSSHETRLDPLEAIKVLSIFGVGEYDAPTSLIGSSTILVSAYDLVEKRYNSPTKLKDLTKLRNALKRFRKAGGFVLIDSGNYEADRLQDNTWSRTDLENALVSTPHDWAFSFDFPDAALKKSVRNRKPTTSAKAIISGVKLDQKLTSSPILPIVHAPQLTEGGHDLKNLPSVICEISEQLRPPMIAVPERELGPGLVESAHTIRRIREALDKLPFYQPIHILGTGNPRSISVYSVAGADSFDGLEWCRYVVDGETGTLHHTQHFDFFEIQARFADSSVTRAAMDDTKIGISGKAAFHNLDYYARFSAKLRLASQEGRLEAFIVKWLGKPNTDLLEERIPGIFK